MTILSHIFHTTNTQLKDIIIEKFALKEIEGLQDMRIFGKDMGEYQILCIYGKDTQSVIDYATQNYEILSFINIGTCLPVDSLDIQLGDIIIPNTFINTQNDSVFFESLTDKNYDLHNFGLILNGICLELHEPIQDEAQLQEIYHTYETQVFDTEGYIIGNLISQESKIQKAAIIKVVGNDISYLKNIALILDLVI